jgi:hypothetical protein
MSADTLDTVVAASTPDSVGAAPAQIDASVSAGAGVRLLAELPPPPLDFRWVHTGSRQLDLPTVPVSGSDLVYRPFSSVENTRLEDAWNAMSPEVRDAALETWGNEDGEWGAKGKKENKDKDKAVKEADKKGREKDKEREKEKEKEKEKRKSKDIQHGKGSNDGKRGSVSSIHEGSGTLGVALSSGLNSDTEVNEVPVDKPELYRSIIEQAQNDPERLDVVKGVPVAQVS